MTSRPQFSLRTMAFVTSVVCLAAAASAPLPLKPMVGGEFGRNWDEMGSAVHAQALLRLAACVVFPTMCIAGAIARRGYARAFCLGALLPTALPLAIFFLQNGEAWYALAYANLTDSIERFKKASWFFCHHITALWACAPCIGLTCMLSVWFLRLGRNHGGFTRRGRGMRSAVMAVGAICAALVTILLDDEGGHFGLPRPRLIACMLAPALLSVGVIEFRGYYRTFFAAAALPTLMVLARVFDSWLPGIDRLPTSDHLAPDLFIVTMWALAPCTGLLAVFFHWLFQVGEAKEKNADG